MNQTPEFRKYQEEIRIRAFQNGKEIPLSVKYAFATDAEDPDLSKHRDMQWLQDLEMIEVRGSLGPVSREPIELHVDCNGEETVYRLEPDTKQAERMLRIEDSAYMKPLNLDENVLLLHYGTIQNDTAYVGINRVGTLEKEFSESFDIHFEDSRGTVPMKTAEKIEYKEPVDGVVFWAVKEETQNMRGGDHPTYGEYMLEFPWKDKSIDAEWKLVIQSKKDPSQKVEVPYQLVAFEKDPPCVPYPLTLDWYEVEE